MLRSVPLAKGLISVSFAVGLALACGASTISAQEGTDGGGARFVGADERTLNNGSLNIGVGERRQRFSPGFQRGAECSDLMSQVIICPNSPEWSLSGGISFNRPARFWTETGDRGYVSVVPTPRTETFELASETLDALIDEHAYRAPGRTIGNWHVEEDFGRIRDEDAGLVQLAAIVLTEHDRRLLLQVTAVPLEYSVAFIQSTIRLPVEGEVPEEVGDDQRRLHEDLFRTLRLDLPGDQP